MPTTKDEKILCITTYLETKSFKTVQAKFCRKFSFNNYPQKPQISSHWISKQPQQEGRNTQFWQEADCKISRQCECSESETLWDSVRRSPKKSTQSCSQELCILWADFKSSVFELETSNLQIFNCYHTRFQEMLSFGKFLVWVINYYHVNGFHLFWDTLYLSH